MLCIREVSRSPPSQPLRGGLFLSCSFFVFSSSATAVCSLPPPSHTQRTKLTSSSLASFTPASAGVGGSEMASARGDTALAALRAAHLLPLKSPTDVAPPSVRAALTGGLRRHRAAAPTAERAPPRATAEVDAIYFYVSQARVRCKTAHLVGAGVELEDASTCILFIQLRPQPTLSHRPKRRGQPFCRLSSDNEIFDSLHI